MAGNKPMRVYFAPCGIGLGHVGRCVPIAKKLLDEGVEVVFSTYREGIRYIEREKLPLIKALPIGFQVKPDGTVDFKQTAVNPGPFLASFTLLRQIDAEIRFIEGFKPDVVVSDSRASPILAARVLGVPRICILNQFQVIIPRKKRFLRLARFADSITLTLIGKIWTGGNTVLIPDFPPPYTICSGNLTIPKPYRKSVKLIGPILEVRPEELPTQEELRKKLQLPFDKPVIFVPISGPIRERAFLIGILRKILLNFPEDYEIVMSLGYPNADTNPVRHGNLTIYKWIPNRFEYLKACDIVIGRAGHGTLTQCLCYGKPLILVPTPNHTEQLWNAIQAEKLGVAEIIQQKELTREKLLKNVKQVLEGEMPERLRIVQKEVVKYDGLGNAVKAVLEAAENGQVF
ncbi:MAG: UDP-N-acetylglucosamine--N-acetylmuramyl-(pentapeptide) pyrophosphoryl-undecaprenol N-acetylglucosamine transferase [Candidatus Bathyarchaeales archaeon]